MLESLPTPLRELDSRSFDGIHVRMLWSALDSRVTIAVADAKTGESFALVLRDGDDAAHVFAHPYAYAAWRGVDPAAGADAGLRSAELLAA